MTKTGTTPKEIVREVQSMPSAESLNLAIRSRQKISGIDAMAQPTPSSSTKMMPMLSQPEVYTILWTWLEELSHEETQKRLQI